MTVNEAYLDAPGATVTSNNMPVMTPGLYDKFPRPPETFLGLIRWFPGPFLISSYVFWVSGVIPYI